MKKFLVGLLVLSCTLTSGMALTACSFSGGVNSSEQSLSSETLSSGKEEASSEFEGSSQKESIKEDSSNEEESSSEEDSSSEEETEKTPTQGLTYEKIGGKEEYAVVGIGTATDTDIVIPATYEGLPVTAIGDLAFNRCYSLISVVIPDSVTSIGEEAFSNCDRLVEVVNNSPYITVEKGSEENGRVGYYALGVYNVGDSYTTKFSNDNGYIVYTDGEEKVLVAYKGTETVLDLPSYITKIYHFAFMYSSLESIVIPDGVTTIGAAAFALCYSLTSVVIPDSVVEIFDEAFCDCSSLTSVTIGNSVTLIGPGAFRNCFGLTSVTISDSVTSIYEHAFSGCENLTSITFEGTVEQWNAIEKGYSWNGDDWTGEVPATEVVCSDGKATP